MKNNNTILWIIGIIGVVLIIYGGSDGTNPTDKSPFDSDELHVLIIEETADRGKLPDGQLAILQSAILRDAVPNFRLLDPSQVVPADSTWYKAYVRPRTALPWWIVSHNRNRWSEGPLPSDLDAALEAINDKN